VDTLYRAQGFRLVLASASPRRKQLLTQAGYVFAVEVADVDESVLPGEAAAAYVQRLAEDKAREVLERYWNPIHDTEALRKRPPGLVVLGADTTVVCDGEILAKPENAEDAMRMLRSLSGRTHEVMTGVAVATRARVLCGVETTLVTFSPIPEAELVRYCAMHEPLDKAGAYGIQGYAARWIPRIEGDYFNVMGLPIARVVRMIEEAVGNQ
jgi:septum formation protein